MTKSEELRHLDVSSCAQHLRKSRRSLKAMPKDWQKKELKGIEKGSLKAS
ncbi:MAG: hypothetical protein H6544_01680 [Prevotellaceae bacterium]|nr:hypothetical protein [Prevotellaceae bacterium]